MTDTPRAAGGLSADTQALMAFEAGKKSMGVAYLLWFFLGILGGHRFYMGRVGTGVAILLLWIMGWVLLVAVVGIFLLGAVGIWVLVDAFLIPGWVRSHNMMLMAKLNSGSSPISVVAAG